jgi:hypothetical protein
MTSHEYALKMQRVAQFLLSRPEFTLPNYVDKFDDYLNYFSDKEKFIAAVRAVGPGTKEVDGNYSTFVPGMDIGEARLGIRANRDAVCKKVQDEIWECEPLLSPEEEAQVGAPMEAVDDLPF